MFFLIRVAFWLSIVILLLPTGNVATSTQGSKFGAGEAVTAASAAFSDLKAFCGRQPEACEVGSQAAVAFGQKAQASAKLIYDFLTEKVGGEAAKPVEVTASAGGKPSQNTLTASDRVPAWRGPPVDKAESQGRRAS
ncbi:MAG: DUF5330 domain-containing protein [Variibacter sp.]|nr:DUF5330 domain-containing protein [Variibacter sp.]